MLFSNWQLLSYLLYARSQAAQPTKLELTQAGNSNPPAALTAVEKSLVIEISAKP